MKKSFVKLVATSAVALTLAGAAVPAFAKDQATVDAAKAAFELKNQEYAKAQEELAGMEVKKGDEDKARQAKLADVAKLENEATELKAAYDKAVADKAAADKKAADEKAAADKKAKEEAAKKAAGELADTKFANRKDAEARLKMYLDNYKGVIHNSGKVVEEFGGFFVKLFVEDMGVAPSSESTTTTKAVETTVDPVLKGYKTKEEAVKAAEALLKKDPINNGYDIQKGADGLYYIRLTVEGTKEVDRKPLEKPAAKPAKKDEKKAELPQTGEASTFAIAGAAVLSALAGLGFVAKKEN